mmetsp:Transcript_1908/g.2748  ORF Transcript_1908/g.2748 Transcript_1908/m.2748 type:complete len:328 (+) Transcript_1908:30-1013(+)
MTSKKDELTTEGFDLDAIPDTSQMKSNTGKEEEVVFELGGRASTITTATMTAKGTNTSSSESQSCDATATTSSTPIDRSEECKSMGNRHFQNGNYLDACDSYTDAIEACPGMTGNEILKLRDEFNEREREKVHERHREEVNRRRSGEEYANEEEKGKIQQKGREKEQDYDKEEKEEKTESVAFQVPPHVYGTKLAVYHCNRAACFLHLERYEDAILDCDIAVLLNPRYVKAFVRRMTAYENTERPEEALKDAKTAMALDPYNKDVKQHVNRLQKAEDERMEKLKEETMGKLKDLGNSILGNFGMSLDNFKAVQDPNTGSYSISYNNT